MQGSGTAGAGTRIQNPGRVYMYMGSFAPVCNFDRQEPNLEMSIGVCITTQISRLDAYTLD